MSDQQQAATPFDEAYALVHEQALQAPFFQKLASVHGIVPADQEQADILLDLGYMLMAKQADVTVKQASAATDFLSSVRNGLAQELGQPHTTDTRQVAYELMNQEPRMKMAALLLQQARAASN